MSVLIILNLIAKNERIEWEENSMEDKYLFKAKRVDNGEWIQGYLYSSWEKRYILWGMTNDIPNMIEVDPSTICQCTGMRDKNSKLIWENDIVKYDCGETRIDFIEYQPPIFTYSKSIRWNLQQDEVVGNIFDNPELLESGK